MRAHPRWGESVFQSFCENPFQRSNLLTEFGYSARQYVQWGLPLGGTRLAGEVCSLVQGRRQETRYPEFCDIKRSGIEERTFWLLCV